MFTFLGVKFRYKFDFLNNKIFWAEMSLGAMGNYLMPKLALNLCKFFCSRTNVKLLTSNFKLKNVSILCDFRQKIDSAFYK